MQPTLENSNVGYMVRGRVALQMWGRNHQVDGQVFDAMNEAHCAQAMLAAEAKVGGTKINVIKVGVLGKDEPVENDPNGVVVDFTDAVVGDAFERIGEHSVRALKKGNVAVVRNPEPGSPMYFAFRTGDSPFLLIVMRDEDEKDLAVFFCHAGRPCLMPDREGAPSVVEAVWKYCEEHGIETANADAVIGGGIGPCCYGFDDITRLNKLAAARYHEEIVDTIFGSAISAPRGGQESVDLEQLAWFEFQRVGFDAGSVLGLSNECTACYGDGAVEDPDKCVLHSSARGHGPKVRNLAVISYVPDNLQG